jgi:DNA-binding FadR family transcriptional regulator
MLQTIDHSGVVRPVLEQFRAAIESGQWPLGSKIPTEEELVQMLGVGRGVVREGLATLKAFGLIEARPGRGTFVTGSPSELVTWIVAIGSDQRELIEARYGVDAWINYLAARRATPAEREHMTELVRQMEEAVAQSKSLDEFVELDNAFHSALADATHNSVLARLDVLMHASLAHSRRANISTKTLLEEAMHSHHELVEAITCHDGERANSSTRRSLRRVARLQGIELDFDPDHDAVQECVTPQEGR